jgi:predicted HicB family RNase H-like nuclease
MPDSSSTDRSSNEGFIGFRCDPGLKAEIEAKAEQRGISVSELARQELEKTTRQDRLAAA